MKNNPSKYTRVFITLALVLIAAAAIYYLYQRSTSRPWTRDGEVRADIIGISSQVNGQVIDVAVDDNQFVKKGDLLFQIETDDYELAVKEAEVKLEQARQDVKSLTAQIKAAKANVEQGRAQLKLAKTERDRILRALKTEAVSRAYADVAVANVENATSKLNAYLADLEQARENLGVPGEDNVRIMSTKVNLEDAKLNLKWTSVKAPDDGYVTNLILKNGDYVKTGTAVMAFVKSKSYYVYGYFKETQLEHIRPGQRAVVTLMGYSDKPIDGVVNSIGRAISTPDTDTGQLVPDISPTFDWVRLAQRVPVRIELKKVPEGVDIIVGTTASVVVLSDKSN